MNILEKGDFDSITIDGKDLTVTNKFVLHEMYQRLPDKQWRRTDKQSLAFQLADNTWIFKIPTKENGEYTWLKMQAVSYESNLGSFYRGDDINFGPARKFAKNGQTQEVMYSLLETDWGVVDIGTFSIMGNNSGDALAINDTIYFVTSKNKSEWLLYLDARKGEAKGTGGVFRGIVFNPDIDVQSVL